MTLNRLSNIERLEARIAELQSRPLPTAQQRKTIRRLQRYIKEQQSKGNKFASIVIDE